MLDANPSSATYNTMVMPHTSYLYDDAGNETAQITADEQGPLQDWLTSQDENNDHTVADFTGDTRFGYDQYGNQVSQTLADGEVSTAQFNAFSQETLSTDADGQSTAYVYDNSAAGQGKLSAKYYFADGVAALDDNGNIQTADAAEASTYDYDALGNVTSVKQYVNGTLTSTTATTYDPVLQLPTSISSPNGTIHYIYDDATGNLIETWTGTTQATADNDIQYGYDNQGRLSTVTQVRVNGEAAPLDGDTLPTTTYTYDNVGNLIEQSQSNGLSTSYTYDALNRLTYEEVDDTANPDNVTGLVFTESFDLNDDGTRADAQENTFNSEGFESSAVTYDWTYDADGRLTGESTSVDTGPVTPYSDTFAYDLEGNRVEEDIDGGDSVSGGSTVNYTYNGDNQLQTQTEHTHGQTGAVYQTTSTYDNDGNLITQTTTGSGAQSSTYSYDERNNMTSATTTAGGTTTTTDYTYDDDRALVSELNRAGAPNAQVTYYLIDPNNPTGYAKAIQGSSTPGGAPTMSFVFGTDVIAQTDATHGTLYLIHDGHGSTRALIDSSGNLVQTYDYDAWGDALDFNPATALTPYLFGGDGTYDPASGFVYQLVRWRDGLYFTQRDSYHGQNQDPLSLHKYLYALGNPVGNDDPSGYFSVLDTLGSAALGAGQYAQDLGMAGMVGGLVLEVASAVTYADTSIAMSIDAMTGDTSDLAYLQAVQGYATAGMELGMTIMGGSAGLMLAGTVMMSMATTALSIGGSSALVQVTSWASSETIPDLLGGRWVMAGAPSVPNWIFSGTFMSAPLSNFITNYVQANQLSWPPGWEWWFKSFLNQRIIN